MYIVSAGTSSGNHARHVRDRVRAPLGIRALTVAVRIICAMKEVFTMLPEFHITSLHVRVHKVVFVDIDWDIGRRFVIWRKSCPAVLPMEVHLRQSRAPGRQKGGHLR